jgi:hypothetical protein
MRLEERGGMEGRGRGGKGEEGFLHRRSLCCRRVKEI